MLPNAESRSRNDGTSYLITTPFHVPGAGPDPAPGTPGPLTYQKGFHLAMWR